MVYATEITLLSGLIKNLFTPLFFQNEELTHLHRNIPVFSFLRGFDKVINIICGKKNMIKMA